MRIIDNFLSEQQLNDLKLSIQQDIETHGGQFEKCELTDEVDHHETTECGLYHLNHSARHLFFKLLIEKGILNSKCLAEHDHTLRYHQMRYPYNSTWHKDRLSNWNDDDVDYFGISYFMHEEWNYTDGGLYIFKNTQDSNVGKYVEPIPNRIIINDKDLWHAVTQITNKEITRLSLQLFIHTKYLNL